MLLQFRVNRTEQTEQNTQADYESKDLPEKITSLIMGSDCSDGVPDADTLAIHTL